MPTHVTDIQVRDDSGAIRTLRCETTTPPSPRPGLQIINGPERFTLEGEPVERTGEGKYRVIKTGMVLTEME